VLLYQTLLLLVIITIINVLLLLLLVFITVITAGCIQVHFWLNTVQVVLLEDCYCSLGNQVLPVVIAVNNCLV
jgi:hypothetical protein